MTADEQYNHNFANGFISEHASFDKYAWDKLKLSDDISRKTTYFF